MQPEVKNKKWPMIILCALCLVFAGAGTYFFIENNKCSGKFSQLDNISTGCIDELRESGITGLTISGTKTPVNKNVPALDVEFCAEDSQLCMKRPGNWMVSAGQFEYVDGQNKWNQDIAFYNQFGTKIMTVHNKVSGIGFGPCEGNPDDIKLTVLETHKLGFKNSNNEDFYVSKAYYQEKNDSFFTPIVVITDIKALQSVKKATNHNFCDIEAWGLFATATAKDNSTAFWIKPELGSPAEGKGFFFREESAVKDWLENSDGAIVYEMLKTAYIKK